MGWTPGPLSEGTVANILKALGVDAAPPSSLADDDPRLGPASETHGSLGVRVQLMVAEHEMNTERDGDHIRFEEDIAQFCKGLAAVRKAASRIRDRSHGASSHQPFGLEPTERDESEEELARWFDVEWERGSGAATPAAVGFRRLSDLADALDRRSGVLVPVSRGRKRTSRRTVQFISLAADLFEEVTGKNATAPKASNESKKNTRGMGSERNSSFLMFLDVLFDETGIKPEKSETIRIALRARKKAGKLVT